MGPAFGLLSSLFLYPEGHLVDFLREGGLDEFAELCEVLDVSGYGEVIEDLRGKVEEGEGPGEGLLLPLQKEYTRLFINAYPKMMAPPYSSLYIGLKELVWGESTSWVVRLYRKAGLEISEDFHDIPDHIAAEMSFGAYLQERIQEGDDACKGYYRELVLEHLSEWVPPFVDRVLLGSDNPFYRTVATLVRRLVVLEKSRLENDATA